ncbi:hypothetical protein DPMN_132251 [Dreissena polymorpha]|uniref:Uncharacterized protein n=1 Tax=Dreissena polymorpha TaxID=45954 RepID=A0A9D4FR81_DREPO|nr:hypothetical protein DPMN_132251 [Dreissena polymorpha]
MYYGSAEKFVNAARHFQDEVFTRVADRLSNNQEECIKSVISADLYCHNTCLKIYLEEGEVLTSTFLNRDMKQLNISHYGHSVTISTNSGVNESDIIFTSDIRAGDIVVKLKNQDIMQAASAQLRKLLKDVDFCLQDFVRQY